MIFKTRGYLFLLKCMLLFLIGQVLRFKTFIVIFLFQEVETLTVELGVLGLTVGSYHAQMEPEARLVIVFPIINVEIKELEKTCADGTRGKVGYSFSYNKRRDQGIRENMRRWNQRQGWL